WLRNKERCQSEATRRLGGQRPSHICFECLSMTPAFGLGSFTLYSQSFTFHQILSTFCHADKLCAVAVCIFSFGRFCHTDYLIKICFLFVLRVAQQQAIFGNSR